MIFGMKRSCGQVRLISQLQMVIASTPSLSAASLWSSARSSRCFLRWSPKVFSWRG